MSSERTDGQIAPKKTINPGRGALNLSQLPRDVDVSVRDIQWFHSALERQLGVVDLALTDNRRRMVSIKAPRGRFVIRMHHIFIRGKAPIVEAIVLLAKGKNGGRETLERYIENHREGIREGSRDAVRREEGQYYQLREILDEIIATVDDASVKDIAITWGRHGKGRRSIRFGSFEFDKRLIRIHPALDQEWVPEYFIRFVVYHELLHALYPPEKTGSGRCVHTESFRQAEQTIPNYNQAIAWEKANLHRFLEK